jgi:anthranilate synthase component 1
MEPPYVVTLLSDIASPVSLYHRLLQADFGHGVNEDGPLACLLESTEGDSRLARYSFIGVDPIQTFQFNNGQALITDRLAGTTRSVAITNPLHVLKDALDTFTAKYPGLPLLPKDSPFMGGLVGYMGYGATQYFERIPQQQADPFNVPEGYYALYDTFIQFDHRFRQISLVSYRGQEQLDRLLSLITEPGVTLPPLQMPETDSLTKTNEIFDGVTASYQPEAFRSIVEQCKHYIREGQVFQIVPSQRFSVPLSGSPMDVYRLILAINPSPYAYSLSFPGFTYLGSSPETFVTCQNGKVVLRALAGTRHRGKTEAEDDALARELKANEKELAEHRMLVDLGRNDLGRVCNVSSIRVGEIAALTRYTHVMHLATEISGTLRDDKTMYDVFQGCFPRGTVSGAPKIRAMQLLSQLEQERRGIYSGVVGYFDVRGNTDSAIAIRSVLIKDGMAHVNAGAGVVYDSDPEFEYQETRNKAKSMLKAVRLASQLAERSAD